MTSSEVLEPMSAIGSAADRMPSGPLSEPAPVILSFDIEEHFRIEAAAGLAVAPDLKSQYGDRMSNSTHWLLDLLHQSGVKATFFVVGQIAVQNPKLVRAIAQAGHEVANHSWDHKRIHGQTPAGFRENVRQSQDALEQATGQPVRGFRAPTFSIVSQTAWAIDALAELGLEYDSSIYPVRHDRYGVPAAPRSPFIARGHAHGILELPPATLRVLKLNLPMGGGGYFRMFPLFFTRWAIRQMTRSVAPPIANLYLHPWEFDPGQPRLPLGRLARFRTYVGIRRTRARLTRLLGEYSFVRAIDVARCLAPRRNSLPSFGLAT